MFIYLIPTSIIYSSPGPRRCFSYEPVQQMQQLGLDTEWIIVPFALKPHGIPSLCGHSYMICASVCLTVMPSFSDITDVLTIGHSFKTDRSRTPLLHFMQYGNDIIGRELNLDVNCLVGNWSRTHNLPNSCDR